MPDFPTEQQEIIVDQPPVFGSWRNIYLFVLLLHLFIIFLFYCFGEAYA